MDHDPESIAFVSCSNPRIVLSAALSIKVRTLRALEHLDPFDVVQIHVVATEAAEINAVHEYPDGRIAAGIIGSRADASHTNQRLGAIVASERAEEIQKPLATHQATSQHFASLFKERSFNATWIEVIL